MNATDARGTDAAELYLSLLKSCLTRSMFLDEYRREVQLTGWHARLWELYKQTDLYMGIAGRAPSLIRGNGRQGGVRARVSEAYRRGRENRDWRIAVPPRLNAEDRAQGKDIPEVAETMIGHRRLDNIQDCINSVLDDNVPGDLIETGVWRGGASIFMRAVLAARGVEDRNVWLADSFEGLPASNPEKYPHDAGINLDGIPWLAVGVDQVKDNFARYGLLDDKVKFLVGWFKDTLPDAPIDQLAVARLDGDLYESTMDAITALYPKLSVGGYLIVDDYAAPKLSKACGQAIDDYRAEHGITESIEQIDWTGVYWRRER